MYQLIFSRDKATPHQFHCLRTEFNGGNPKKNCQPQANTSRYMVAPSYNSEDNQVRAQAKIAPSRGERYIETIASLDQWSMTIENH